MRFLPAIVLLAVGFAFIPSAGRAGLAISANDGKQLQTGESMATTPDSVSVIDLGHYPPKVVGNVAVPASMIGPPEAVVVGAGEKFAIVTASQKFNAADPLHPADDDKVSVIDLSDPARPKVLQTLASGAGASGVALNRAQTLVLVAAKMDDAVYVFRLSGKTLIPAGRVELGKGAAPTDVVFAPDGRKAYAVAWGITKIMELAVEGAKVTLTGNDVVTGRNPYGASITPDGAWLINTNVGGAAESADHTGTITMVDLKTHHLVLSLPVGKTPEHVQLSPDGKYALVVLANGAPYVKTDPQYDSVTGILKVFAMGPGSLTEVAHADSCHWAQGAAWSDDGQLILQQCASEHAIQVFRFDGHSLVQDKSAALIFESRPGAVATQRSR